MTRDRSGFPGRAVHGRLGRAVNGLLASRGLTPSAVPGPMARTNVYRVVAGQTRDPTLRTFLAICRTAQTDPTTLLEMAGLWPTHPFAAGEETVPGALDYAALAALGRLEALPPAEKRWALGVVQALLDGAPSCGAGG